MDKSLSIFMMAFFGISGTVILILAWVEPMPVSEKVLTTLVGSVGLLIALSRALLLRSTRGVNSTTKVAVEVQNRS